VASYDGVGRAVRNGLNFTERGFGIRGAVGIPDRGHTAASQLKVGDFDWDDIFRQTGVCWLHTGGIFAALSDTTPALVEEAVQPRRSTARLSPTIELSPLALEIHRRPETRAGSHRRIARNVDVMIGNEEDSPPALASRSRSGREHLRDRGGELQGNDRDGGEGISEFQSDRDHPARRQIGHHQRLGRDLLGGRKFYEATNRKGLEILDRVGGGTVSPPA